MRKRSEFDRHTVCREFLFDVRAPTAGAHEPFPESIPESLLLPDVSRGVDERPATDAFGPQREYARLFSTQVVALARRQPRQDRLYILAVPDDALLALAPVPAFGVVDDFVNDAEIAGVVHHALIRRVFGKDADPEIYIPL